MFNKQIEIKTNHRNNFTKEYYDHLRFNASNKATKKVNGMVISTADAVRNIEINKHNTPYDEADVIIAYTHKTRKMYNKLMCENLGIENIWDTGTKVICKSNDCREDGIYNNFCFKVKEATPEIVTLISDRDIEYEVSTKKFIKHFEYAYARTLHSTQGSTLNSFHFAVEDINWLNGRELYTLISRLKQQK